MRDPKTTIAGAVTGFAAIVAAFGFQVPSEVVSGIIAIGVFAVSMLAGDSTPKA